MSGGLVPGQPAPLGDRAVLLPADDAAQAGALRRALLADRPPGVEDLVPGRAGLVVVLTPPTPAQPSPASSRALLAHLSRVSAAVRVQISEALRAGVSEALRAGGPPDAGVRPAERPVVLDVRYDGPDLLYVARAAGLDVAEVVARHTGSEHVVAHGGFAPGFAYLDGLDPALHLPRRATPRSRVPAGSVAVAGGCSAVYPSASPGGWHLLGTCGTVLFDPRRDEPALLAPGTRVRFRAVDDVAPPPARPSPSRTDPGGRALLIEEPGLQTLVVDAGRTGWAHVGVPRSGPVDAAAHARALLAVGGTAGDAALEVTGPGPVLRARGDLVVAWSGDGRPGLLAGRRVAGGRPHRLPDGAVLDLRAAGQDLRCVLAVRGGLAVPRVLGSATADLLGGLGPPPLTAGDVLGVGRPEPGAPPVPPATPRPLPGGEATVLRLLPPARPGLLAASLPPGAGAGAGPLDRTVDPRSDRTALRLAGLPLPVADGGGSAPSEGLVPGAVQLPPDGVPLLFLAGHPPTGGYPLLGVVVSADLPLAAQLRPGDRVRLVAVPAAAAAAVAAAAAATTSAAGPPGMPGAGHR